MNYPQIEIRQKRELGPPPDLAKKIKRTKIKKFVLDVLSFLGKENWDFSILFCGDDFIRELNKKYREKDEATDVLSFVQQDAKIDFPQGRSEVFFAGDIVISLDTLKKNAEYFNVSINEELKRLLVHGILHLDGMDHEGSDPAQEMLIFQEKILYKFSGVFLL